MSLKQLLVAVLNGACENGWCSSLNGTVHYHVMIPIIFLPRYQFHFINTLLQPFGVSYSGATFKYTILDTTGRRSAAQGELGLPSAPLRLTDVFASFSCSTPTNCVSSPPPSLRFLRSRTYEQLHREPLRWVNALLFFRLLVRRADTFHKHGRCNSQL